jgi:hypothetical protein
MHVHVTLSTNAFHEDTTVVAAAEHGMYFP